MAAMAKGYSVFSILRHAFRPSQPWPEAWPQASPKANYDAIIIGGGGHGLATAYYLAKNHGLTNIAVLEKGYIGSGNVGRNTTIIRSNYMLGANTAFFEKSLQMWEGLSHELDFNCMVSHRGQIVVAVSPVQMDTFARRGNVMRLNGIDAELLDRSELQKEVPYLDYSKNARFPIWGAIHQRRAGTVRHDAVAWGYARAAAQLGVDIIENCEVTGILKTGNKVTGVETSRGRILSDKVGIAVAGHTSQLARMVGLRLPVESHILQAFVTEPVKPICHHVISWGAELFYMSQSDKGGMVFGGHLDGFNTFTQRGQFFKMKDVMECAVALAPFMSRLRLLRSWGGINDMTPDGSPFICLTPVDGLYLNGGWCYQGFKATPASGLTFAHTMANNAPHELSADFALDRLMKGKELDEHGIGNWTYKQ
jgi:heterotetrameric sarcosine oxidase beta subunit